MAEEAHRGGVLRLAPRLRSVSAEKSNLPTADREEEEKTCPRIFCPYYYTNAEVDHRGGVDTPIRGCVLTSPSPRMVSAETYPATLSVPTGPAGYQKGSWTGQKRLFGPLERACRRGGGHRLLRGWGLARFLRATKAIEGSSRRFWSQAP